MAEQSPDIAALPFETALAELEQIVKKLEEGTVPLEQSIALYERGEILKQHCDRLLQAAETRVNKITTDQAGRVTGAAPLDGE